VISGEKERGSVGPAAGIQPYSPGVGGSLRKGSRGTRSSHAQVSGKIYIHQYQRGR